MDGAVQYRSGLPEVRVEGHADLLEGGDHPLHYLLRHRLDLADNLLLAPVELEHELFDSLLEGRVRFQDLVGLPVVSDDEMVILVPSRLRELIFRDVLRRPHQNDHLSPSVIDQELGRDVVTRPSQDACEGVPDYRVP